MANANFRRELEVLRDQARAREVRSSTALSSTRTSYAVNFYWCAKGKYCTDALYIAETLLMHTQGRLITLLKGLRAALLSWTTGKRLRNRFVLAVAL